MKLDSDALRYRAEAGKYNYRRWYLIELCSSMIASGCGNSKVEGTTAYWWDMGYSTHSNTRNAFKSCIVGRRP